MKSVYLVMWAVLLVGAIALTVVTETLPPETKAAFKSESGPVETVSAFSYLLAAALLLWQAVTRDPARWSLALCVACLGLRELDFDKRFTTMGIFKSRFYLSSEVPAVEKVAGALISLAIIGCMVFLLKKYFRGFVKGLREKDGMAWSIFGIGIMLIFVKSIDGLGRKLKPLGIEITDAFKQMLSSTEEVFEAAISLMLTILVLIAFRGLVQRREGQRSK